MLTPTSQPIEAVPPSAFRPGHCPWPECSQHHLRSKRAFNYRKGGFFKRKCDGRRVQRYLCLACGRSFSQQSFSCTYYLKRPELLQPIAAGLNAGSAHRQLGRTLGCAPSTVTRTAARLGRHALLLQSLALSEIPQIHEPVVLDHFETFAYSQYDPVGVATAVGSDSWFSYLLEPAPHNRSGRMSPAQKQVLQERDVPPVPPGQVVRSTERALDLLATKVPPGQRLALISDEHPAYASAMSTHDQAQRFEHRVFANPKRGPKGSKRSQKAVIRDRALFPVDLFHGLWRHSCAHHRRETIAFCRRVNALMERGLLLVVWRNFVKGRSERKPDRTTPAMRLGVTDGPWSWSQVLGQRLFPSRIAVPGGWMEVYRREWVTPALPVNTPHRLVNAF